MPIDLRSDTVTQPTPGMKQAMMDALLGDDVLEGDPTTKQLQEKAAKMFGKQAGLFFPTGTMSNLCALMAWTGRGEGILTGDLNHIVFWEQGGMSQIGGIPNFQLPVLKDSTFDLELLENKLKTFAPVERDWVLGVLGGWLFSFLGNIFREKNRKKKIEKKNFLKKMANKRQKPSQNLPVFVFPNRIDFIIDTGEGWWENFFE